MWKNIRPFFRSLYRFFGAINGFFYDLKRFFVFSGWKGNMKDDELRNYNAAMVYHGLEKSLSYKERNPRSGWNNALKLLEIVKAASMSENIGYNDRAAMKILEEFVSLPENINDPRKLSIEKDLASISIHSDDEHGIKEYKINDFHKGVLKDPETFFNSRYSLREFSDEVVTDDLIKRAVRLALKTPSVCNRQAWAVYHTCDQDLKDAVLQYQSGNKPFGKNIPNLMIVSSDLKAFFSGSEHYQHWIDGGLFSMSLIYAFHSLGVATCALNWSQTPANDKALRKDFKIKESHTVIMILAIGYPNVDNKVCISARRPLDEVYNTLEKHT